MPPPQPHTIPKSREAKHVIMKPEDTGEMRRSALEFGGTGGLPEGPDMIFTLKVALRTQDLPAKQ